MRNRSHFLAFLVLISSVACCGSALYADSNPDAEVKSFTFRKFNDQGLRLWDLSGKELAITSTKDEGETVLRSPNARIYVEENQATGDGFLFVEGNGFRAEGKDWEWRGTERKIEIRKGAKVTFDEAIRRILK